MSFETWLTCCERWSSVRTGRPSASRDDLTLSGHWSRARKRRSLMPSVRLSLSYSQEALRRSLASLRRSASFFLMPPSELYASSLISGLVGRVGCQLELEVLDAC